MSTVSFTLDKCGIYRVKNRAKYLLRCSFVVTVTPPGGEPLVLRMLRLAFWRDREGTFTCHPPPDCVLNEAMTKLLIAAVEASPFSKKAKSGVAA